jgi:hypothetical protein
VKEDLVSIVILTWNTPNEIYECLKSLQKQTYKNFEVVLVDNGSSPENIVMLKNNLKNIKRLKIKTIFNKKNLGFCEGNNVGVRSSRGEYVVFLSDDTIVDKKWLEYLLDPFSLGEDVGGTIAKVIFYGNRTIQYAGGRLTFYGKAVSEGLADRDRKTYNIRKRVLWGQGCSLMLRRKVINELGECFCPQFFIYCDDLDLSWRVNGLGYKIIYEPRSWLLHKGSVAVERNADPKYFIRKDQLYRNLRNKYLTFWRNLSVPKLFLIMPFVFGYDIVKSFYLIAKGCTNFYGDRFNYLKTMVSAFMGFLKLLPKVKKPRRGKLSDLSFF